MLIISSPLLKNVIFCQSLSYNDSGMLVTKGLLGQEKEWPIHSGHILTVTVHQPKSRVNPAA